MSNELIKIAEENGLEKTQAEIILSKFTGFFDQAKALEEKARAIKVTDASQKQEIALAHDIRMQLKDIRVAAEKVRKSEKEVYLRGGKAIDSIGGIIKDLIAPLEAHLAEQELFAERQEAKQKEKLSEERSLQLSKFLPDTTIYNLKEMSQEAFETLLKNSEIAHNVIKAAEEKTKEDQIKKEKEEKAEQDRVKAENEKLKKDKEEAEKLRLAEKKKADDEKKKLEDEKAKVEKELQDKKDADARATKEKEAEAQRLVQVAAEEKERLAGQSDKEKLLAFAKSLENLEWPVVKSEKAKTLLDWAKTRIDSTIESLKK